jgi:ABC-type sugar transport system permease subunit
MTTPMDTPAYNPQDRPLSVGDWIITLVILAIPLVGLLFLLYWALSSDSNLNRKNFCVAYIVIQIAIILIVVAVFAVLMFMGALSGVMNDYVPA